MAQAARSRRIGRPVASDGDVRAALVRAAATQFGANGFAGASTREILEDAGATAPALYHQFGSKAGLYVAVASAAYDHVLARFTEAAAGATDPVAQIEAILDCVVELRREHPGVARFFAVIDRDVRRYPELVELRDFRAQLDALWNRICMVAGGDTSAAALATRTIIEGFLRVGTDSVGADEIAATCTVLKAVIRAGQEELLG